MLHHGEGRVEGSGVSGTLDAAEIAMTMVQGVARRKAETGREPLGCQRVDRREALRTRRDDRWEVVGTHLAHP